MAPLQAWEARLVLRAALAQIVRVKAPVVGLAINTQDLAGWLHLALKEFLRLNKTLYLPEQYMVAPMKFLCLVVRVAVEVRGDMLKVAAAVAVAARY